MLLIMEYIWLDAKKNFRSKTKVLEHPDTPELKYADFPVWSFDGSSTGQAEGNDSEVFLCPVLVSPDPFRKIVNSHCFLVLCVTAVCLYFFVANNKTAFDSNEGLELIANFCFGGSWAAAQPRAR